MTNINKCFICLEECKTKFCKICNLSAHLPCWSKYISHSNVKKPKGLVFQVFFSSNLYQDFSSFDSPKSTIKCPICRNDINTFNCITRQDLYNVSIFLCNFHFILLTSLYKFNKKYYKKLIIQLINKYIYYIKKTPYLTNKIKNFILKQYNIDKCPRINYIYFKLFNKSINIS